jgi:hypothetical protein
MRGNSTRVRAITHVHRGALAGERSNPLSVRRAAARSALGTPSRSDVVVARQEGGRMARAHKGPTIPSTFRLSEDAYASLEQRAAELQTSPHTLGAELLEAALLGPTVPTIDAAEARDQFELVDYTVRLLQLILARSQPQLFLDVRKAAAKDADAIFGPRTSKRSVPVDPPPPPAEPSEPRLPPAIPPPGPPSDKPSLFERVTGKRR